MINETGNTENTDFADESSFESHQTSEAGRIKELGKRGLEPIFGVLSRHRGEFSPYFDALTKALTAGAQSLEGESSNEVEKNIAKFFHEGSDWLSQWKDKLATQSPQDFLKFLEEEGKNKPALLFGVSYFGGLLLGRFGRHLGKNLRSSTDNIH
ncbi:MAG: hypothetical protein ACJ76H_02850 [Bacteriovoracaceae bacterium]